jgi:hypothetical protein
VEAKKKGADGELIEVEIADVKEKGETFTLVARWEKTKEDKKVADIAGTTLFGYEIKISAPNGGALAPPQAGTFALTGGAEKQDPKPATAIIMSNL